MERRVMNVNKSRQFRNSEHRVVLTSSPLGKMGDDHVMDKIKSTELRELVANKASTSPATLKGKFSSENKQSILMNTSELKRNGPVPQTVDLGKLQEPRSLKPDGTVRTEANFLEDFDMFINPYIKSLKLDPASDRDPTLHWRDPAGNKEENRGLPNERLRDCNLKDIWGEIVALKKAMSQNNFLLREILLFLKGQKTPGVETKAEQSNAQEDSFTEQFSDLDTPISGSPQKDTIKLITETMVREQGELYNVEQEIKKLKARKDDREVEKSRLEQRQTGSVQMDWGDNAEKLKRTDYDIVMNKNQDNDRFSSDESQERNDFNQEGSIRLPTLYIAGIPKPRVESSYLLKVTVYNILKSLLHEKIKWSDIMSSYRYRVPPARGKICVVVKNNSLKQIILEKGSLLVDCGVRISDSLSSFQQGEQNDEEQEQKSSSKQKPVNQQRITKCLVQNGEITHVDEYRPSSGNGRGKRNKNKRVNTFLEKKSETSYRSDLVMSTRVELSSTYTT